ncbi:hypothetical protein KBD08_01645 [Candidatus Babeliales bacterium]|nr:hypothetical protein [Candidatus Babeliales bacterium]
MKRFLFLGLLGSAAVVQSSFNPLLLKGTTEALQTTIETLEKSEVAAQGKVLQSKNQAGSKDVTVKKRPLTDAEKMLYEDCAPFWGLMYLEKGIAEQWYRLSPKHMYQDISLEQLAAMKQAGIVLENNSIESLIVQMYHIPGTAGSFAITSAQDNPVRLFTAKDMGSLLHIVSTAFDKHGKIKHEGQFKAALEDRLYRYLLNQPDGMKINQNTESRRYKKDNGKAFTKKDFGHFVNALVGAVVDCQKETSAYPARTPQHLLISYMLAKSKTRDDLQEYMKGLLGDDQFVLSDEKYTEEEIDHILDKKKLRDLRYFSNSQDLYDYTIASIYEQNYQALFPKIAVFNNDINYKGSVFTNCGETMVENLINIATYNHKKHQMGDEPTGVTLSVALRDFYTRNAAHVDNLQVGSLQVQKEWLQFFENQDGVIYKKIIPSTGSSLSQEIFDDYDGFIKVSDQLVDKLPEIIIRFNEVSYKLYEKTIGTKKYLLVPKSSGLDCFEMRARPSNIVMMISKLLNLGFTMSVDDVFKIDVVSQNFKNMCDVLGWKIDSEIIEQIKQQQDSINMKVTKDGESFVISLYVSHAVVFVENQPFYAHKLSALQFLDADKEIVALTVGSDVVDSMRMLEDHVQEQKFFWIDRYINLQALEDKHNFVRVVCMGNVLDYDYIQKIMMQSMIFEDMLLFNKFFWELLANPSKHASFIDAVKNMLVFLSKTDKMAHFLDIYIQDDFFKLEQVVDILYQKNALDKNTTQYVLDAITTASKSFDSDVRYQAYTLLVSMIDKNVIKTAEINRISLLFETLYKKLSYGMRKDHLEEYNAMLEKLKKGSEEDFVQPKVVPVQHAEQSKMMAYERERYDSQESKTLDDVSRSDDTVLVR